MNPKRSIVPINATKAIYRIVLWLLIMLPAGMNMVAQTVVETPIQDSNTTEKVAEPERYSPSLEFTVKQLSDILQLTAKLKGKINGAFYNLYALKVVFTLAGDSAVKPLGNAITDKRGIATIFVSNKKLWTGSGNSAVLMAVYGGNKSLEAIEESVTIKRAGIEMETIMADSVRTLQIKFSEITSEGSIPVPETTVGIYVARTFKPLKIGEITTDAEGSGTFEVPYGLPGDDKGNFTLIANIEENEQYGNIESKTIVPWGKPISSVQKELPRALWSSHPPIWMLVTFIILITLVWGHYIVILYELFRLRKEEPKAIQ